MTSGAPRKARRRRLWRRRYLAFRRRGIPRDDDEALEKCRSSFTARKKPRGRPTRHRIFLFNINFAAGIHHRWAGRPPRRHVRSRFRRLVPAHYRPVGRHTCRSRHGCDTRTKRDARALQRALRHASAQRAPRDISRIESQKARSRRCDDAATMSKRT